jgi:hypothetical protein
LQQQLRKGTGEAHTLTLPALNPAHTMHNAHNQPLLLL